MYPLQTIQTVYSAAKYLYDLKEKVKENKEECARLSTHVQTLLQLIEAEYTDGPMPDHLDSRLAKLHRYLTTLPPL